MHRHNFAQWQIGFSIFKHYCMKASKKVRKINRKIEVPKETPIEFELGIQLLKSSGGG